MSLKLNFGLTQKLRFSQKMKQSLRILSLSCEELSSAIQQELLENPLLEAVESTEATPPFFKSSVESASIPSFLPYEAKISTGLERTFKNKAPLISNLEESTKEPVSLKSYVLKQAEMSCFPQTIKLILFILISHLDERAYLDLDLELLAKQENIPLSLLQEALKALQSLEPAGLGARNLQECLLIQLQNKKEEKANLIVENHLDNLKNKKYKAIAYDLNICLEEFYRLKRIIQSLEPNPARNFSPLPTVYIQPDIYIYKQGTEYQILINKDNIPDLRLSKEYGVMIEQSSELKNLEKKYISERMHSAKWFIQSIQKRQEKLKNLARYLISHQKNFFETGGLIKPLKMQDLANFLDIHVSTISRTIQNKHAHTPFGLIPLRRFFQKGLTTENGQQIAISVIKKAIQQLIETENPENPLSDEDLRNKLREKFQIYLLRRSVGFYRSSMNIPPLRVRRRDFLNQ